jgi:hypothetical protein
MTPSDLRIGTLGAARITPMALIWPARSTAGVSVTAVAARDKARADKFARKHRIGKVHDDYGLLLADPEIDAVYNPLPNSLHAEWTLRALDAGKHVLCEKPFTSNAPEAERVHQAAEQSDRVVMEAFHYRYHPLDAGKHVLCEKPFTSNAAEAERRWTRAVMPFTSPGRLPERNRSSFRLVPSWPRKESIARCRPTSVFPARQKEESTARCFLGSLRRSRLSSGSSMARFGRSIPSFRNSFMG